jgi:hypothetical protein
VDTPAVLDGLSSTWADVQRDEFAAAKAAISFRDRRKARGTVPEHRLSVRSAERSARHPAPT